MDKQFQFFNTVRP